MMRALRVGIPFILTVVSTFACSGTSSGVGDPDGGSSLLPTEPGDSANVSSQSEQVNGACPNAPKKLTGTSAVGESCSTFAQCKPSCCSCSGGSSYLAAACVDGVCASKDVACGRAKKAFCGDSSSSSSSSSSSGGSSSGGSSTSSSSSGGSSGGSSSGSSGGSPKVCVQGSSSYCYGTGMTWTGTQCCVDGPATCTEGSSSSCYGSGMKWTGSTCCVTGNLQCVAGSSSSCYGTGLQWTGAQCCVSAASTCVAGSSSSCYGAGKRWTGSLCCLD